MTRREESLILLYLTIVLLLVAFVSYHDPTEVLIPDKAIWVPVNLAIFVASMVPLIFLHEMGHALTAVATGFRPFFILIGVGHSVYEGGILGLRIQICRRPLSGFTFLGTRNPAWFRTISLLSILNSPRLSSQRRTARAFACAANP